MFSFFRTCNRHVHETVSIWNLKHFKMHFSQYMRQNHTCNTVAVQRRTRGYYSCEKKNKSQRSLPPIPAAAAQVHHRSPATDVLLLLSVVLSSTPHILYALHRATGQSYPKPPMAPLYPLCSFPVPHRPPHPHTHTAARGRDHGSHSFHLDRRTWTGKVITLWMVMWRLTATTSTRRISNWWRKLGWMLIGSLSLGQGLFRMAEEKSIQKE